jgi:hypothetical protein
MKVWLVRAGSHGEYESKFLQENRVYVTWDNLDLDLGKLSARTELISAMTERYPQSKAESDPELGKPGMAIRPCDGKGRLGGGAAEIPGRSLYR